MLYRIVKLTFNKVKLLKFLVFVNFAAMPRGVNGVIGFECFYVMSKSIKGQDNGLIYKAVARGMM